MHFPVFLQAISDTGQGHFSGENEETGGVIISFF